MTKEQVSGVTRHILTFVGGILIAKGLIDEATITELVGALSTIAGTVWSILAKKK